MELVLVYYCHIFHHIIIKFFKRYFHPVIFRGNHSLQSSPDLTFFISDNPEAAGGCSRQHAVFHRDIKLENPGLTGP